MAPLLFGEVRVWRANARMARPEWVAYLDDGERARLSAYVRAADAHQFLTGAALIRLLFARELGLHPADVRLDRGCADCHRPHGPVRLARAPAGSDSVRVSVSHSGDWILVAACRGRAVGVDVEVIATTIDHLGIGRLALHEVERSQLAARSVADRAAAFTTWWVRKEAVVKVTGDGLRVPLGEIRISSPDEAPALLEWPTRPYVVGRLQLRDLPIDDRHRAAVAVFGARPLRVELSDAAELVAWNEPREVPQRLDDETQHVAPRLDWEEVASG